LAAAQRTPLHAINTNQNLIGLVNGSAVLIHHPGSRPRICPVGFILHERGSGWLIIGMRSRPELSHEAFPREPRVK
jgi:chemotaxis protein CheZ